MRTISSQLQSHLEQNRTTLALCFKITRTDNTVIGCTGHDVDIVYDGVTYKPIDSIGVSQQAQTAGVGVDNADAQVLFEDDRITQADIRKGLYDGATLESFLINYKNTSQGIIKLISGLLGESTLQEYEGTLEFRSLTQHLQQPVGRKITAQCDADFADSLGANRCKLVEATYSTGGTVETVTDNSTFTDSSFGQAADFYKYGKIVWLTGNNAGLEMEVKDFGSGQFTLFLPMENDIEVGDTFNAVQGCDKEFTTCRDTFNNAVNFRGFPDVPGRDKSLQYVT